MSLGKTIATIVVVYIIYSIIMAGGEAVLLADQAEVMAAMSRAEPMMGLAFASYFVGTIAMVLIYNQLIAKPCPKAGALYGALIGVIYAEMSMVNYAVLPIPEKVMIVNCVGVFLASLISGVVIAKMQPAKEE